MDAESVIEQIRKLLPEERGKVREYLRGSDWSAAHVYWYIEGDPQLSSTAQSTIQDASNEVLPLQDPTGQAV